LSAAGGLKLALNFGGEAVGEGDAGELGGAAEVVGEDDYPWIRHRRNQLNRRKRR
jgi:hypothetical protein